MHYSRETRAIAKKSPIKPKRGESEMDFVSRCVKSTWIREQNEDERVGITATCWLLWDEKGGE